MKSAPQSPQPSKKSELFYVKKRGLLRRAEQVKTSCNSDVFIVIHNKENNKIFSYTSDPMFNLEVVSELILKEVKKGAYLHKNQVFASQNFEKVYQDISTINELTSSFNSNETSMP